MGIKIVTPFAKPLRLNEEAGIAKLRDIEYAARLSHRSEDSQTDDSWERFLHFVIIEKGDWSVVEHAHASVHACCDRAIQTELVRHRLASYTWESTRFVNYAKKMPPRFIMPLMKSVAAEDVWIKAMEDTEQHYQELIRLGEAPQIARSVFPQGLASEGLITTNLRSWRHKFLMRTTKEAHPQMREIMIPLLGVFKSSIPILFEDIEPNARQIDNMRKPR